ncbi:MAG TPA: NUDIX hydrolase [Thermodesulfovibrionales bacterium]|nr:NUDIX hydrolase [Thermodesulfovibrionales bacterium]
MGKYTIVHREPVWEGRYLRCLKLTYRDSEGALRNWETVERVNCDGVVAIVPITDQGEVLLIRQFRPAVKNYVVEFPAGLNDRGERHEDAALRELREETGYEAAEIIFLAEGPLSSGSSSEVLTVFLARGLQFKGIEGRDETEDIEVLKIPLDQVEEELARFVSKGDFIDLKIFGFMELAKKHGHDRQEQKP